MSYITLNSAKLAKRVQEINFSNEMLSHGISELEALYLRIQSGTVMGAEKNHANENAVLLNDQNHSLAHAINEALKEVESNLREQLEVGLKLDKEVLHEFTVVLRESIKIFHEYRMLQEGYQKRLQQQTRANGNSFYHYINTEKAENHHHPTPIVQQVQRFIKNIFICGAGTNFQNY